jgi:hypothetical protein
LVRQYLGSILAGLAGHQNDASAWAAGKPNPFVSNGAQALAIFRILSRLIHTYK